MYRINAGGLWKGKKNTHAWAIVRIVQEVILSERKVVQNIFSPKY
jgi:hypothetical protein